MDVVLAVEAEVEVRQSFSRYQKVAGSQTQSNSHAALSLYPHEIPAALIFWLGPCTLPRIFECGLSSFVKGVRLELLFSHTRYSIISVIRFPIHNERAINFLQPVSTCQSRFGRTNRKHGRRRSAQAEWGEEGEGRVG